MSALEGVRRLATRIAAFVVNDRRPVPHLGEQWLNRMTWQIVRRNRVAGLRPHYVWGLLQAAALGKTLGHTAVTALELGVAGGRGLMAMEAAADEVSDCVGVGVIVYGLDTGAGLPPSRDPRDLPNLYAAGEYRMDEAALRARLHQARLVIGPIRETASQVLAGLSAPIGFISCDVDLYSSTVDSFPILEAPGAVLLPRVQMYFDDVLGLTFSDWNGERLAIREFNERQPSRKIDAVHGLRYQMPWPLSTGQWCEKMYLLHIFDHVDYCTKDHLIPDAQLPLDRPKASRLT